MADVGIIMGSQSDWPTLKEAATLLDELGDRATRRESSPPTGRRTGSGNMAVPPWSEG